MNKARTSARVKVPDHVPPGLVFDFAFEDLSGIETNAVTAAALRALPDIFFTVRSPAARHDYEFVPILAYGIVWSSRSRGLR